nr:hypothetical protein [Tanacetum cinerariifolium]GFA35171.1 hypothetical protein [Tanacetum cinerariifolium]
MGLRDCATWDRAQGHLTVAADFFFYNDLEYLKSFDPERTYTTSITKTKVAWYEIVGIEDMVPTLWSPTKVGYGKDALKGIKHWGERQIVAKRADRQLYKFKEGDFMDLYFNDIEDMLLLAVQHKLFHLNDNDIVNFIMALRMFTRSLVVESNQKKLNITAPQKTFPEIEFEELYTLSYKPPGVIYEDLNKQKRVMRTDELYKFSDHIVLDFRLGYNNEMSRRKWTAIDKRDRKFWLNLSISRCQKDGS